MRIAITILVLLTCLTAFSQRERQIGQHGLIHYTPYAKFDSVRTTSSVGIGTAPGTYKLNVNGTIGATGTITSTGSTGGFQVNRRDNNADAFVMFSLNGNLDFYSVTAGATKLFMTSGGVLKYSADMSGSYDSRSVPDKAYVDAAVSGAASSGEDVTLISADYTVPTTSKMVNLIHTGATAHTVTLPTGSTADRMVIYVRSNASTLNFSTTIWETTSTSATSIAGAQAWKLIYKNADSKWYAMPLGDGQ